MHPFGIEGSPVVRNVVVGVRQAPAQPLELQRLQLVAARPLDRLELARLRLLRGHAASPADAGSASTLRPSMLCDLPRTSAMQAPCWFVTTMS